MEADRKAVEEAEREKKSKSLQGKLGWIAGAATTATRTPASVQPGQRPQPQALFESEKPEKREIEMVADTLETVSKRLELPNRWLTQLRGRRRLGAVLQMSHGGDSFSPPDDALDKT